MQHTQTHNKCAKAHLEIKKTPNQPYPGNTTETGWFELLSIVYLRHQDKFQAKILADLCYVECLHTIFIYLFLKSPDEAKLT